MKCRKCGVYTEDMDLCKDMDCYPEGKLEHWPVDIEHHGRHGRVLTVHLDKVEGVSLEMAADIAYSYAQNIMYKGKPITPGCFEEER